MLLWSRIFEIKAIQNSPKSWVQCNLKAGKAVIWKHADTIFENTRPIVGTPFMLCVQATCFLIRNQKPRLIRVNYWTCIVYSLDIGSLNKLGCSRCVPFAWWVLLKKKTEEKTMYASIQSSVASLGVGPKPCKEELLNLNTRHT